MKRRRLRYLAALAAAIFQFIGASPVPAGDALQEKSELHLDPSRWRGIEVENSRGSVEVHRSADGQFHLTAVKTVRTGTRRGAAETARQIEVTTDEHNGQFVVAVHYPQRSELHVDFWDVIAGGEVPRIEVQLVLEAPAGLPIRLRSASGDLLTEDREGMQDLETSSGDIQVERARGALQAQTASGELKLSDIGRARLRTASGDISVSAARGALFVHTTSGDLSIEAAVDSLRLDTVSGDIRVDAAPRGLEAGTVSGRIEAHEVVGMAKLKSSSGDLDVSLAAPLRRAELSTVSGEIRIQLPQGAGCQLDLRTTSGSLEANMPMVLRSVDRRSLLGEVGGGGAPIVVRTSSGDVTVMQESP